MELEHAYAEGRLGVFGVVWQFVQGTVDMIVTGFSCFARPRASACRIVAGGVWSVALNVGLITYKVWSTCGVQRRGHLCFSEPDLHPPNFHLV